jgi:hypothetical protein
MSRVSEVERQSLCGVGTEVTHRKCEVIIFRYCSILHATPRSACSIGRVHSGTRCAKSSRSVQVKMQFIQEMHNDLEAAKLKLQQEKIPNREQATGFRLVVGNASITPTATPPVHKGTLCLFRHQNRSLQVSLTP